MSPVLVGNFLSTLHTATATLLYIILTSPLARSFEFGTVAGWVDDGGCDELCWEKLVRTFTFNQFDKDYASYVQFVRVHYVITPRGLLCSSRVEE